MFSRRLKTGYFILEGMNSFATVYYFYYFYFFMHRTYGFGNKANLALAALTGGVYALCSLWAGRFAQRFGYFTALKAGFLVMMASLLLGLRLHGAAAEIIVMVTTTMGMCFTWPTLEALVSEGEPAGGLQHMVGLYNVVWAGTAAAANFSGGAMLEKLGSSSLFYVPIAIQAGQLGLTLWLEAQARASHSPAPPGPLLAEAGALALPVPAPGPAPATIPVAAGSGLLQNSTALASAPAAVPLANDWLSVAGAGEGATGSNSTPPAARPVGSVSPKSFLRMAWLANPFAYIAINTVVATMPAVAGRLKLSTMLAGFCGSVWCFARLGSFFGLWYWNGWHYRFRWLLAAYLTLIASFAAMLLTPSLTVLVLAQLVFGCAIGLIYYSSLFYSMDLGDTKGEHGGIHEAAIGLGNCTGPALGAATLVFLPQYANSGAIAVTLLLLAGLGGLGVIWRRGRSPVTESGGTE